MTTYNIHEAKTHFSKLLEQVSKGEEVKQNSEILEISEFCVSVKIKILDLRLANCK